MSTFRIFKRPRKKKTREQMRASSKRRATRKQNEAVLKLGVLTEPDTSLVRNPCPQCGSACVLDKRENTWGLACCCGYWKAAA